MSLTFLLSAASTSRTLVFDMASLAASLLDPAALFIVLMGTIIATVVRVGTQDMVLALRSAAGLVRAGFNEHNNRTALARWARAIRARGVLAADESMPPDRDLSRALQALLRTGSITALQAAHDDASTLNLCQRGQAVRVFEQAGDLAPVFGLVGTLFSITQLAPATGSEPSTATLAAIATAVLSTLYGVLAAHFIFLPIANAVARQTQREDNAREELIGWLAHEIADTLPSGVADPVADLRTAA